MGAEWNQLRGGLGLGLGISWHDGVLTFLFFPSYILFSYVLVLIDISF